MLPSRSKDNVVILKSSKISVFFDGKRVKLEGSNLLKNKLCGLCGDNNNNKIADVPSPRKCLLSKPKLELASYRVSLPSKPCSPLPSHLKEELERESEGCILSSRKSLSSPVLSGESERCDKHLNLVFKHYYREIRLRVLPPIPLIL